MSHFFSETTISRRRRQLGLLASGRTTLSLPDAVKRQLVLDQMAKDPEGRIGAITVKARIFRDTGIDITRSVCFIEKMARCYSSCEAEIGYETKCSFWHL
jgi:hypothetical protein